LSQSFKGGFEVVLVNDGSYEAYDDKYFEESGVRYFHIKNRGMSGARNFGVSKCKGHFICLCDDDDYLLSEHLSVVDVAISQCGTEAVLTHSQGYMEYSGDKKVEKRLAQIRPNQNSLDFLLDQGFRWVSGSVFPRIIALQFPFRDRQFSEAIYQSAEYLQHLELLSVRESTVVINFDENISGATRGDSMKIGLVAFNEYVGMLNNPLFNSVSRTTLYRQIGKWNYAILSEEKLEKRDFICRSLSLVWYNAAWGLGLRRHIIRFLANLRYVLQCILLRSGMQRF
jgi:glycosyltransferase involved in cell wall biosynthesis